MNSKLKVVNTGSKGNCLIIEHNGKHLLLDVGLPRHEIQKALNYQLKNIIACLASHKHLDHVLSLPYFINKAIPCYGNKDVCDKYAGCELLPKILWLDGFKIQHFDLDHNVPNTAYVVDLDNGIRVLYITDTKSLSKRVKNVTFAIVECNHSYDTMIDNMVNDESSRSHPENHLSLEGCIEYLKEIYSPSLQGVLLWHLSETNIDAEKALARVKEELGFENVWIACKGLEIELNKEEF